MEVPILWYLVIGTILILVGLSTSFFAKMPITTSIFYFIVGMALGNHGLQLIQYDLIRDAVMFERITELVVIISLFSAGIKLRLPFRDSHWSSCWRLATVSMVVTVGLITLFGIYILKLPLGLSILLGAILAPTDPVLASEVQVSHTEDRDRLRFSLTGEAGLNDGTAFPFVMLGLGLMGLHELGDFATQWLWKDVVWAGVGGLGIGWLLGSAVSKLVLILRKHSEETIILDDFLALGLIALAYGIAHVAGAYGFLAVFAAGLAMRKIENQPTGEPVSSSQEGSKTIAKAVLSFTEQMERIGEVFVVLLLGTVLNLQKLLSWDLILIPVLFLLIRPIGVLVGLGRLKMRYYRRPLICWFGIRGIGSIYYLAYAIHKGLPADAAERITTIVYATVVASVFIHGITGLPFMNFYQEIRRKEKGLSS